MNSQNLQISGFLPFRLVLEKSIALNMHLSVYLKSGKDVLINLTTDSILSMDISIWSN